ncbi:MAG: hypothetical protein N3E36_05095 [Sulfolobales archaeon]|nr:hypothetical protein [Sulfolobales archaeon]MCX8199388.1 hypothetical protein [Sulfolobales archaeon]MDW8170298.1 hypothetical protein [Desulfurococcaceae archaeon]
MRHWDGLRRHYGISILLEFYREERFNAASFYTYQLGEKAYRALQYFVSEAS